MSSRMWVDFISILFKCSKTCAKNMYHRMVVEYHDWVRMQQFEKRHDKYKEEK